MTQPCTVALTGLLWWMKGQLWAFQKSLPKKTDKKGCTDMAAGIGKGEDCTV